MPLLLGCIADDLTDGADLAGMLVKHGKRTAQTIGVPSDPSSAHVDAVVIALKSRTSPVDAAVVYKGHRFFGADRLSLAGEAPSAP